MSINPIQPPPAAQLSNPYLDLWYAQKQDREARQLELSRALLAGDEARLRTLKASRVEYTHRFGYAVPTAEALETLSQFSPLVEIGAGVGYWAWMLRQGGTDIVAYDLRPPTVDSDENRFHARSLCWTNVLTGNESALDQHPDRTLFLCWPPRGDPMAYRILRRYRGEIFVYVGEQPLADGANVAGDDQFVQLLSREWLRLRSCRSRTGNCAGIRCTFSDVFRQGR